jgi:hypothetical protein
MCWLRRARKSTTAKHIIRSTLPGIERKQRTCAMATVRAAHGVVSLPSHCLQHRRIAREAHALSYGPHTKSCAWLRSYPRKANDLGSEHIFFFPQLGSLQVYVYEHSRYALSRSIIHLPRGPCVHPSSRQSVDPHLMQVYSTLS